MSSDRSCTHRASVAVKADDGHDRDSDDLNRASRGNDDMGYKRSERWIPECWKICEKNLNDAEGGRQAVPNAGTLHSGAHERCTGWYKTFFQASILI